MKLAPSRMTVRLALNSIELELANWKKSRALQILCMDVFKSSKRQDSTHFSLAEVFNRAAELLRNDWRLRRQRSNSASNLNVRMAPFPLRAPGDCHDEGFDAAHPPGMKKQIYGTFLAVNHLAGFVGDEGDGSAGEDPSSPKSGSSVATLAEKRLMRVIVRNRMWGEANSSMNFEDFFKRRNVDYMGEEIKVAQNLVWDAVSESLPEGVGSLPLRNFCRLGTQGYVDDFERYLVPQDAQVRVKPPKVMIKEQEWPKVCSGLICKKVCEVWRLSKPYHIDGAPLLNGLFAVGKGEFKSGLETQRLIMNLHGAGQFHLQRATRRRRDLPKKLR